jgi:crotonobetainyl-CoA:carnitine CoA-transferase CaiB-like acyl-CoA transferase
VTETLPLQGIKILDFTRQMSGPYASLVLGDFGADVIKVESYPEGDPSRGTGTYFIEGESTMFLTWNRNKRSICVDLRRPEGLATVKRLVEDADVLMENYRPGVADEIGIGYEAMSAVNPRLVYCSVNAFGSKGPWKGAPGTDPIVQAMSGIMSVTGEADGGPSLVGIPVADYTSAMLGVQGVLLALAGRGQTGKGQHVEVSMLAGLLFGLTTRVGPYFLTGENPERHGGAHSQVMPYQAFEAKDGWVVAGVWGRGWDDFCQALGVPELAKDPRFATNADRVAARPELAEIIGGYMKLRTKAEWQERFMRHKVLFSPVSTFSDVLEGEQARANELVTEVEHPKAGTLRQVAPAVKLSDTPATIRTPPPLLGEHTRELLLEHGWSTEEIEQLVADRVVVEPAREEAATGA